MIKELQIVNFRGFEEHSLSLKDLTIIVGRNNAGKSTIVEALRLISIVTERYKSLTYRQPPDWLNLPVGSHGVQPSLRNYLINYDKATFFRYGDPPAQLTARFDNGASIVVYLGGEDRIFAVIRDRKGKIVDTRSKALNSAIPLVSIMPQIGPLSREETLLNEDYVTSSVSSHLASIHFRNQLNFMHEYFDDFKLAVAETWPGVQVRELMTTGDLGQSKLRLFVRNDQFVAEIALMGHGLQMWLQTMWFLTRSEGAETVILDEPDVYMHADLQRRLVRYVKTRMQQTILTTHSVEIMSEVEPENILIVDRARNKSVFCSKVPAVQRIVQHMGSVHNLHLAKLSNAKKFLLLEGHDLKLLKRLHNTLFPNAKDSFESIPNMDIGGWSGWHKAVGSSLVLRNALGESIRVYCLLDRDYYTPAVINERYEEATVAGVSLHIWAMKEIENYLLAPVVIARVMNQRSGKAKPITSTEEVATVLEQSLESCRDSIFDAVCSQIHAKERALDLATVNARARSLLESVEDQQGSLLSIAPGKEILTMISEWSQRTHKTSISATSLAAAFRHSEICDELCSVLQAIEECEPLSE